MARESGYVKQIDILKTQLTVASLEKETLAREISALRADYDKFRDMVTNGYRIAITDCDSVEAEFVPPILPSTGPQIRSFPPGCAQLHIPFPVPVH